MVVKDLNANINFQKDAKKFIGSFYTYFLVDLGIPLRPPSFAFEVLFNLSISQHIFFSKTNKPWTKLHFTDFTILRTYSLFNDIIKANLKR